MGSVHSPSSVRMVDTAELGFDFELLCELTEASGAPGYEDRIREIVRREPRSSGTRDTV